MTKPVIAIDIDDVLVDTAAAIVDHINRIFGASMTLADYYSNDPKVYGCETTEQAIKAINTYQESQEFFDLTPFEPALAALRQLQDKYSLVIVTSRAGLIEQATNRWIQKHFEELFDGVHFAAHFILPGQNPVSKAEICQRLSAEWLLDDHLAHIQKAAEVGIKGLLFGNYPWNQTDKLPTRVKRVADWDEVLEQLL